MEEASPIIPFPLVVVQLSHESDANPSFVHPVKMELASQNGTTPASSKAWSIVPLNNPLHDDEMAMLDNEMTGKLLLKP
jgi:hypothetical protein